MNVEAIVAMERRPDDRAGPHFGPPFSQQPVPLLGRTGATGIIAGEPRPGRGEIGLYLRISRAVEFAREHLLFFCLHLLRRVVSVTHFGGCAETSIAL